MRHSSRRSATTSALALLAGAAILLPLAACTSPPGTDRRTLAASAPTWGASAAEAVVDGDVSASVVLSQDATDADTARAIDWLSDNGLEVGAPRDAIGVLPVAGSRAELARAFDTSFARTRTHGRDAIVPTRDLSVPADLVAIESVAGLVDTDAIRPAAADAAPLTGDDCARYWGEKVSASWPARVQVDERSNALCGYGPAQLRAIHELPADATGEGATIAIVGVFDDERVRAHTDAYFASAGEAPFADGQYTSHAPDAPDESRCGGPAAWTVEQHLDVQAAHAIAPDADIVYWGANDCLTDSLYLRLLDAVEASPRPDVISLSFGGPEELDTDADRTLLNRVLVEAASRGVSVFASTGNEGDFSLAGDHADGPDVASPASSPYVTAVGGASVGLGADDRVVVEAGWEIQTRFAENGAIIPPGFLHGAGGGESEHYARPSWQRDGIQAPGDGRLLPDVASLADPNTGFTIAVPDGAGFALEAHGGTSLATPMVAATVAVAKARTGVEVGLATPYLYALADTAAFRDIQPASAATWYRRSPATGQLWLETLYLWDTKPQTLQSGPGWDAVTGLGIPRGADFLDEFGADR